MLSARDLPPKNVKRGDPAPENSLGGEAMGARPARGSPEMLRMVSGHQPARRGERADVLAGRSHVRVQQSLLLLLRVN